MKSKRKRGCLISGMVVVALVAVLAVWIHVIGRDIEPGDFSDLALPTLDIPPEDNAYTYFVKAGEALVCYSEEYGYPEWAGSFIRYSFTNTAVVAKVLSDNEEVFKYLRQGMQCQECVFPNNVTHVSKLMDVMRLLNYKVKYEQERGDFDVAIHDIHTLLRYGQLVRQTPSNVLMSLVGLATEDTGLQAIQHLARDPQLSEFQLKCLLEMLSVTPPYDVSVQNAIKGEFHFVSVAIEKMATERITLKDVDYPFYPSPFKRYQDTINFPVFSHMFIPRRTQRDMAHRCRTVIPEIPKLYGEMNHDVIWRFDLRDLPSWRIILGLCFGRNYLGRGAVDLATQLAFNPLLEKRCMMDGNIAATRIIVACHLFERETGRRPQTLDELVPGYLPSVPFDPFDGKPFRYKPDDGIVYSVGKSLTDLGGAVWASDTPRGQQELDEVQTNPWEGDNAVFHIWEQ